MASQNAWPSLGFDISAINELASPFLGAGFYYKTFMGPGRKGWMLYEPSIRRAAGLGKASFEPDHDRYDQANAFCDVLVVGGGPAGLSAALVAGRTGARVILCDDAPVLGGGLDLEDKIGEQDPADWLFETTSALEALPNVRFFTRTSVYGYYDDDVLGAVEHPVRRAEKRACGIGGSPRATSCSQAARSSGLSYFPATTGPASCWRARRSPTRAAMACRSAATWRSSPTMTAAGSAPPRCPRRRPGPRGDRPTRARPRGGRQRASGDGDDVPDRPGRHGSAGGKALKSLKVEVFDRRQRTLSGAPRDLKCDALAVSAGWSPLVHLASQAGAPPVYSEAIHAFLPGEPREHWVAAGAIRGIFDAAAAAARMASAPAPKRRERSASGPAANGSQSSGKTRAVASAATCCPLFEIPAKGKAFVDLQNDVTASDVRLAQREGFESVEHLKRYTTLGMAADQGKTSNLNGLTILAEARGLPIPAVGTTRFRPPYNPVTLGVLAGRAHGGHLQPLRRTPLHDVHLAAGGEMMNVGPWQRPRFYRRNGETLEQAYVREARAVRASVGITDVSTLGKIDVQGPDAATFLDRVYTNTFSTLPVGKARYGLMLRDDGFLYDDGTTWRLAETAT